MIEVTFGRNEDYLDGHGRGPYRWLLNIAAWRFHLVLGRTTW